MTGARVVITTEVGHCRQFRCMADAAGYKDLLLREGEQVLITSTDPATGKYSLTALVHTDHPDEIWGGHWDSLAMAELGRWVKVAIESEYPDGRPMYYCAFFKPLDPVPANMTARCA